MARTEGCQGAIWSQSRKARRSPDCSLQLDCMKLESLVIADQHAAVNTFPGLEDLTSSPPSSGLSPAVSPECPALPDGNRRQGLRSLRDLTQHLTTRADDSHAAPLYGSRRKTLSLELSRTVQTPVRFFALRRIKPHAPPLVRAPVNSFEF